MTNRDANLLPGRYGYTSVFFRHFYISKLETSCRNRQAGQIREHVVKLRLSLHVASSVVKIDRPSPDAKCIDIFAGTHEVRTG